MLLIHSISSDAQLEFLTVIARRIIYLFIQLLLIVYL